jgi:Sec-independent protein secretion pathway component TatC
MANDHELQDRGGQMSFLEHLDELRRRLVNVVVIIVVSLVIFWLLTG